MNENPINLTKWTDTELSGTIHSDGYKTMFTSIPYDKGWKLFVDGVETETRPVFDTFIAADLAEGDHEISFTYNFTWISRFHIFLPMRQSLPRKT